MLSVQFCSETVQTTKIFQILTVFTVLWLWKNGFGSLNRVNYWNNLLFKEVDKCFYEYIKVLFTCHWRRIGRGKGSSSFEARLFLSIETTNSRENIEHMLRDDLEGFSFSFQSSLGHIFLGSLYLLAVPQWFSIAGENAMTSHSFVFGM